MITLSTLNTLNTLNTMSTLNNIILLMKSRIIILILLILSQLKLNAQATSEPLPAQVGVIDEHISKMRIYSRRRRYPDGTTVINRKLRFNNSITPQGMAIYGGKLYQFRNGGYCQVVDIATMRQVESFHIPMSEAPAYANAMHLGAVAFSNEYSGEPGYTKKEGGLPYLYVMLGDKRLSENEKYGTVAVIDISHNYNMLTNTMKGKGEQLRTCRLVRYFRLKMGGMILPNFIAAFDFDNGKGWVFGYDEEKSSGATAKQTVDFIVREFRFPQSGNGDVTDSIRYDSERFTVTARCGNLQDCVFHEGMIYLSCGGSESKQNPMDAHIAIYDPKLRAITSKHNSGTKHESEGIDIHDGYIYQTFNLGRSDIRICKIPLCSF